MNHNLILGALLALVLAGCASKSKKDADIKDQEIKEEISKKDPVGLKETIGVNGDKDVVVQKRTELADYLKQITYQVKAKQDEIYGSRKFGTRGLYGRYEKCFRKSGMDGSLIARNIALKDDELGQLEADRFGYDKTGKFVALEETKMREKIRDLESKRNQLFASEEELRSELVRCEAKLETPKQLPTTLPEKPKFESVNPPSEG